MTKPSTTIDQAKILELLTYDPDSGVFVRRIRVYSQPLGKAVGTLSGSGNRKYLTVCIGRRNYFLHRLAWLYMTGSLPESEIDHINGDRLDNRWANLRAATRQQNLMNRKHKLAKSGVKGVHRYWNDSAWYAQVGFNGKTYNLGTFQSLEDAANAVKQGRAKLHGEFCNNDTL